MTVSTSVRRVGTVSAATVALVLSGGGLALAAALPSDTVGTTLSSVTDPLPTLDPTPLPTLSPLPLPLPTSSPTPTASPTPSPTQSLLPALPGTGSTGGTTSPTGSGGTTLAGGATAPKTGTALTGPGRSAQVNNETYPAGSGDHITSWALPASYLLQPTFDLPGAAALAAPGVGTMPLVAGSQPELIQLASAPRVAPAPGTAQHGDRQVAGLVIVFAVVTIGGVAAGHASLLQQRLAHRSA